MTMLAIGKIPLISYMFHKIPFPRLAVGGRKRQRIRKEDIREEDI